MLGQGFVTPGLELGVPWRELELRDSKSSSLAVTLETTSVRLRITLVRESSSLLAAVAATGGDLLHFLPVGGGCVC